MSETRHSVRSAMVASRREPALRSQSIGVGLLAIRARTAVKRAFSGQTLTERDTAELTNVREVLTRAAEALRYGTASRAAPGGRQLTSVGLTLSSITPPRAALDREVAAEYLAKRAADIDVLLIGRLPASREELQEFLTGLLRSADRDTGQSGEILVRREP